MKERERNQSYYKIINEDFDSNMFYFFGHQFHLFSYKKVKIKNQKPKRAKRKVRKPFPVGNLMFYRLKHSKLCTSNSSARHLSKTMFVERAPCSIELHVSLLEHDYMENLRPTGDVSLLSTQYRRQRGM